MSLKTAVSTAAYQVKMKLPRHSSPISFSHHRQWIRFANHNKRSTLFQFSLLFLLILFVSGNYSSSVSAQSANSGYLSAPDESRKCLCDNDLSPFDASIDRFSATGKVEPDYSTRWDVSYHKYYKRITVKLDGSSDIAVIYAYICGAPKLTTAQKNAIHSDSSNSNIKYAIDVEIPFRSVGLFSTTFTPPLEYIGQRHSIVHLNADFTSFGSCIRKLYDLGKITEDSDDLDEVIQTHANKKVDALFYNSFKTSTFLTKVNEVAAKSNKIKVIPMTETYEKTYLGLAEHVEYMALFFNRELAAKNIADNINLRFNCTAELVKAKNLAKPKVLIASGSSWGYFPPTCPNWKCHMIENAGAELIQFSYTTNHTTFIQNVVSQADVWIYDGANWNMSTQHTDPYLPSVFDLLKETNVYKNKRIYDIRKQSYNEWFTSAQAEPDVLLRDFVSAIFEGQNVIGTHNREFLRNVFNEEPFMGTGGDPALCTDVTKPTFKNWIETGCAVEGEDGDPVVIPGLGGDTGITYPACVSATPSPTSEVDEGSSAVNLVKFNAFMAAIVFMIASILAF